MSQFVRDARIAMIYEGANGIQAMDLVGRKLGKDGGRAMMAFFSEVGAFCQEHAGDDALKPYVAPLAARPAASAAGDDVVHEQRPGEARQCGRRCRATTCTSSDSSRWDTCGRGWRRRRTPRRRWATASAATMEAKLLTGRFFMERMLPETGALVTRIAAGSDTVMAMPAEMF